VLWRLELPGLKLMLELIPWQSKLLRVGPKLPNLLKPHHILLSLLLRLCLGHGHREIIKTRLASWSPDSLKVAHSTIHGREHISQCTARESLETPPRDHLISKFLAKFLL